MSEEERLLKFENELNFGIETRDGTFYVPKDVAVKAASELLDELAQPQLTIPQSIAESKWMKHLLSCDLSQFEFERFDEFLNKEDEQFLKWVNTGKNENILYIYLAGKALGVDLVKVVEG